MCVCARTRCNVMEPKKYRRNHHVYIWGRKKKNTHLWNNPCKKWWSKQYNFFSPCDARTARNNKVKIWPYECSEANKREKKPLTYKLNKLLQLGMNDPKSAKGDEMREHTHTHTQTNTPKIKRIFAKFVWRIMVRRCAHTQRSECNCWDHMQRSIIAYLVTSFLRLCVCSCPHLCVSFCAGCRDLSKVVKVMDVWDIWAVCIRDQFNRNCGYTLSYKMEDWMRQSSTKRILANMERWNSLQIMLIIIART